MGLRFLHTADWHVGKPFGQIPGDAGAILREERIAAVGRVARIAAERAVDAVLVAGDAFDGHHLADATLERLLAALEPFRGRWLFLPGNHDAHLSECVWTRLCRRGLPSGVEVIDRAAPIVLAGGAACLLPAPLTARRTREDLTVWMDGAPSPSGALRIGLAHGSVEARLPAAAEASNPIAADRAATAGLDYLALGDWHGTLEVGRRCWYPGTPEPDRFVANEAGQVLLVELDGPGTEARIETIGTGAHRWTRLALRLDGLGPGAVADHVEGQLAALQEPGRTVLGLTLDGAIGLDDRLALDGVLARQGPRFRHLQLEEEGLRLQPGAADLGRLDDGGLLGELARTLHGLAAAPEADPEQAADASLALRLLWKEMR